MRHLTQSDTFVQIDLSVAAITDTESAMIVGWIHSWIQAKEEKEEKYYFHENRYWVYNSNSDWERTFPFMQERTIRRKIQKLRNMGILITGNFNKKSYDRTLWYTIDYDVLDKLVEDYESSKPYGQNDHMDTDKMSEWGMDKMSAPIPYIPFTLHSSFNNLNGAFGNARQEYPKDFFEELSRRIYTSADRLGYDSDTANRAIKIIYSFMELYRLHFGILHPMMSQKTFDSIVASAIDANLDEENIIEMIDKYFNTDLNTDYHLPHFFSEGILTNRAYETGYKLH